MRIKWRGSPRLVAAMAGFLIFAGMILLGIAILSVFGYLNVGMLLEGKYLSLVAVTMIVVGLLDVLSALVIARW